MSRRTEATEALNTITAIRAWALTPAGADGLDLWGNTIGAVDRDLAGVAPLRETVREVAATGRVFYVTPGTAETVRHLSRSLPHHPVPSAADLGTRSGWIHFAEPIDFLDGLDPDTCQFPTTLTDPQARECRVLTWHVENYRSANYPDTSLRLVTVLPFVAPDSWDRHHPGQFTGTHAALGSPPLMLGSPDRIKMVAADDADLPEIGDDVLADQLRNWEAPESALWRWVLAFAALVTDDVLPVDPGHAPRPIQRNAQRAGVEAPHPDHGPGTVSVIDLPRRRTNPAETDGGGEGTGTPLDAPTPVAGHWRLARVGKGRTERRLTFVRPHLRGADLDPANARPRVYRVDTDQTDNPAEPDT